jgi:hypothetical protein
VPKPASDLEKYFAGEFAERQDALPVALLLVAMLLVVIACAL